MSDQPAYPPPPDQPPPGYPPAPTEPPRAEPPPAETPPAATPPVAYAAAPASPPPPAYPAPAPPPPAAYPLPTPPAPYPAPAYPAPPYGYPPPPAAHGPSRRFWLVITAGIVALVLLVGAASYGIGGYVLASNRISNATATISAVSSQRTSINSSFDTMAQQVTSFDSSSTASAAKSKAADMVSQSQTLASMIAGNTQALHSAQLKLNDLSWLTALSRGSLQDASGRIDHARTAVVDVKTAADDYTLLGGFMQSYFQIFVDLDNMITANQNNDSTGYTNAFRAFSSEIANALQLADVPGLPAEYHEQLTALQAVSNDIRQESLATDQAAYDAAKKKFDADSQRADAVNFSGATAAIHAFYQHFRDDFNLQLDQATA